MTGTSNGFHFERWNEFFSVRRSPVLERLKSEDSRSAAGPVYVVESQGIILTAFAEAENLADWTGRPLSNLEQEFPHRDIVVMDSQELDARTLELTGKPHWLDQREHLRSSVEYRVLGTEREIEGLTVTSHFLVEALESWWARVLPSGFGLYLQMTAETGALSRHVLVVVRGGRVESVGEPDLSGISRERRDELDQVVKFLSESALVPVQGLRLGEAEWGELMQQDQAGLNPWRELALQIRREPERLVPFRWPVVALLATRAWAGV